MFQYNQLEDRLTKTTDSEQTIEELEETVMKLRGQLSDLDRLQTEKDQLETKLKTVEEELKGIVCETGIYFNPFFFSRNFYLILIKLL